MKISSQVHQLEAEIRSLKIENNLLRERLRSGWKELKKNPKREKIRKYIAENPTATLEKIREKCGLTTTSLVVHHLRMIKLEQIRLSDPLNPKNENKSL